MNTVYVELWFDVEKDREWKITLWQIDDYDFDPMTAPFITLDLGTENQHAAREVQLGIVRDLKVKTNVVANAYVDRSRFLIRPRWFEELLSPLGRIQSGQGVKNGTSVTGQDREHLIADLRQTYSVWLCNQG